MPDDVIQTSFPTHNVSDGNWSGSVLMQWGAIVQFQAWPNNIDEWEHHSATDWARKEILGAPIYREWVGEDDEEIRLHGKLFPYYFAAAMGQTGLDTMDALDNMRRAGHADSLMLGGSPGIPLGWYVITRLSRKHRFLGIDGIGRELEFEAVFVRVPSTDPATYYPSIWPYLGG